MIISVWVVCVYICISKFSEKFVWKSEYWGLRARNHIILMSNNI